MRLFVLAVCSSVLMLPGCGGDSARLDLTLSSSVAVDRLSLPAASEAVQRAGPDNLAQREFAGPEVLLFVDKVAVFVEESPATGFGHSWERASRLERPTQHALPSWHDQGWTMVVNDRFELDLFDIGESAREIATSDVPTGILRHIRFFLAKSGPAEYCNCGVTWPVLVPAVDDFGLRLDLDPPIVMGSGDHVRFWVDLDGLLTFRGDHAILNPILTVQTSGAGNRRGK